ncbi:MAG: helix-turn-helix domain-containing protein [Chitinophagales bacterium]|nr:helix-turn-helix domain-containing protein [Chitinophagales bacterium]
MKSTIFYPCKALSPYIEYYRELRFEQELSNQYSFRDYPRAALDMVFCFKGAPEIVSSINCSFKLGDSTFVGHFDNPYEIRFKGGIIIFHVRFKANGVYPLTKIPLEFLTNNSISLNDLLNERMDLLHERLAEKTSSTERIKALEIYLLNAYQDAQLHHRLDYGLGLIHQSRGLLSVKQLTSKLNTNYKSLNRWFLKHVGLSPKRYIQIIRFKHILTELEQGQEPNWLQLAVDYGFHDQAHFIKEFKQFSGNSPSIFMEQLSPLSAPFTHK